MLNKKQAHIIAAHGYKIVDKSGNQYRIDKVEERTNKAGLEIYCKETLSTKYIFSTVIGTDYFILCLPYEALTKEVNGGLLMVQKILEGLEYNWDFYNGGTDVYFRCDENEYDKNSIHKAPNDLVEVLLEAHSPPRGIPTECLKFIEV